MRRFCLRLSVIQAELRKLAAGVNGGRAEVVNHPAALLNLLRDRDAQKSTKTSGHSQGRTGVGRS
jgi:hypothetical protein